jgi:hypothetical protein
MVGNEPPKPTPTEAEVKRKERGLRHMETMETRKLDPAPWERVEHKPMRTNRGEERRPGAREPNRMFLSEDVEERSRTQRLKKETHEAPHPGLWDVQRDPLHFESMNRQIYADPKGKDAGKIKILPTGQLKILPPDAL